MEIAGEALLVSLTVAQWLGTGAVGVLVAGLLNETLGEDWRRRGAG